jgi:ParB-like chromosome segregation protein Spo0J
VPLAQIDFQDPLCRFRGDLRIGQLAVQIAANGQRQPGVLRQQHGVQRLQIICGFRRVAALRSLGHTTALAEVCSRLTDEEAMITALVSNEADFAGFDMVDRGRAALAFQRRFDMSMQEIAMLMRATREQVELWSAMADFPPDINDPQSD